MPSTKGGPNPTKDNAVRVAKRKATKKEQSANQNKKHRELQLELAKQLGLKGPVTFNSVAAHFAALAHLGSDRASVRGGMSDAFRADVQFVEEWVKHELRQMDGSHDWWHIHRVRNTALAIARKERPKGDDPAFDVVVELAALVHDVRDWKYSGDANAGAEAVRSWLTDHGHPTDDTATVVEIVSKMGFKEELSAEASTSPEVLSPEFKVVQDADRLDAIGALHGAITEEIDALNDARAVLATLKKHAAPFVTSLTNGMLHAATEACRRAEARGPCGYGGASVCCRRSGGHACHERRSRQRRCDIPSGASA